MSDRGYVRQRIRHGGQGHSVGGITVERSGPVSCHCHDVSRLLSEKSQGIHTSTAFEAFWVVIYDNERQVAVGEGMVDPLIRRVSSANHFTKDAP